MSVTARCPQCFGDVAYMKLCCYACPTEQAMTEMNYHSVLACIWMLISIYMNSLTSTSMSTRSNSNGLECFVTSFPSINQDPVNKRSGGPLGDWRMWRLKCVGWNEVLGTHHSRCHYHHTHYGSTQKYQHIVSPHTHARFFFFKELQDSSSLFSCLSFLISFCFSISP